MKMTPEKFQEIKARHGRVGRGWMYKIRMDRGDLIEAVEERDREIERLKALLGIKGDHDETTV